MSSEELRHLPDKFIAFQHTFLTDILNNLMLNARQLNNKKAIDSIVNGVNNIVTAYAFSQVDLAHVP